MRHAVFGRQLGRDTEGRKALLRSLANSLINKGAIKTTLTKAKFARPYIEQLVTLAKYKRLSSNRKLAPRVDSMAFTKLIGEYGPGFATRSGGYLKITKLPQRRGDAAPMARLEFVTAQSAEGKTAPSAVAKKSKVA